MNMTCSASVSSESWDLLRQASDQPKYLIIAPETSKRDMRLVLIDMLSLLLANKHIAMLAESNDPAALKVLRILSPETQIIKRGDMTCLFAELDQFPSAQTLCNLPRTGMFRLRFAGFRNDVPGELIFTGLLDRQCPADIVLDCTYVSGRPALSISFLPDQLDENTLVSIVRKTTDLAGDPLHINFAS